MQFLPLTLEGKSVYASFWSRLGASLVDLLILVPIVLGLHFFYGLGVWAAYLLAALTCFLYPLYHIYFNAKYGGTLGKLFFGIRVTRPNGDKIVFQQALLRSSVDLFFAVMLLVVEIFSISQMLGDASVASSMAERTYILSSGEWPDLYNSVDDIENIWVWSELLVMLMNKYRQALHDFIAGTVVINKEYSI